MINMIPKISICNIRRTLNFFSWDSTLEGCGGEINALSGKLHSPNYPDPYNDESDCIYTIKTNLGSQIDLIFDFFDIEGKYKGRYSAK